MVKVLSSCLVNHQVLLQDPEDLTKMSLPEHKILSSNAIADESKRCSVQILDVQLNDMVIESTGRNSISITKTNLEIENQTVTDEDTPPKSESINPESEVLAPQAEEANTEVDSNRVSPLQQPDLVASIKDRPSDLPGVQSFNLGNNLTKKTISIKYNKATGLKLLYF